VVAAVSEKRSMAIWLLLAPPCTGFGIMETKVVVGLGLNNSSHCSRNPSAVIALVPFGNMLGFRPHVLSDNVALISLRSADTWLPSLTSHTWVILMIRKQVSIVSQRATKYNIIIVAKGSRAVGNSIQGCGCKFTRIFANDRLISVTFTSSGIHPGIWFCGG
jgi:hypothetical protein